jgi:hypothetical protein
MQRVLAEQQRLNPNHTVNAMVVGNELPEPNLEVSHSRSMIACTISVVFSGTTGEAQPEAGRGA